MKKFLDATIKTLPLQIKLYLLIFIVLISLNSCFFPHKFSQSLPGGKYLIKEGDKKDTVRSYTFNDTVYLVKNGITNTFSDYLETLQQEEIFIRHSFDIDAFTTPFKMRPGIDGVPMQLNSALNGAVYLGYRTDHFVFRNKNIVSAAEKKSSQKIGYGFGGFFGLGAALLNSRVLGNAIDYEYDGFVLEYGSALLISFGNINTGIAIGADALVDKYRRNWIYQHKPWVGVILGINLN